MKYFIKPNELELLDETYLNFQKRALFSSITHPMMSVQERSNLLFIQATGWVVAMSRSTFDCGTALLKYPPPVA